MFRRLKALNSLKDASKKLLALLMAYATMTGTSPVFANPVSFSRTATPIKHVVIVFQENVSFDHYFGTYPHAKNPKGEPPFFA